MKQISPYIMLIAVTGFFGCKSKVGSKVKGHYENSASQETEKSALQQKIIPEFAPSQGVIIAEDILKLDTANFVKDLLSKGKVWLLVRPKSQETAQTIGAKLGLPAGSPLLSQLILFSGPHPEPENDITWARDWAPLFAKGTNNALKMMDFNYYKKRPYSDSSAQLLEPALKLQRISIPLYLEGGNLMVDEKYHCAMSRSGVQKNQPDAKAAAIKDMRGYQDEFYDEKGIENFLIRQMGCEKVHFLPTMPHEATGHLDMWAKFMGNNIVFVSQIPMQGLAALNAKEQKAATEIATFLDQGAAEFAKNGYNVQRIPMPLPSFKVPLDPEMYGLGDAFLLRTYTNSLLYNGTAYVPQYTTPAKDQDHMFSYKDGPALEAQYTTQVAKLYEASGYKVVWVPSDKLIVQYGAVHCSTMQVPLLQ